MRRYLVLLAFLVASPAMAADYYFSDCTSGCLNESPCNFLAAGSKTDPYCLDPGTFGVSMTPDGLNESLMILFDGIDSGANHEAQAGDRIFLCAGACDGAGSATYHVSNTHAAPYYWFCSTHSGTSGAPITIQNYCNTASPNCEKVTISGDNADGGGSLGHYTSTQDVDNLLTNACSTGISYIQWKGNDISTDSHCTVPVTTMSVGGPPQSQEDCKGLILEKSGQRLVLLEAADSDGITYSGGPTGWKFDGLVMRYSGDVMWSGVTPPISFFASGCPYGAVANTMVKTEGVTGPFTIQNSVLHSACGFFHRDTNNTGGGPPTFLYQNNEYFNAMSVMEEFFNVNSVDKTQYARFTFHGNYVHDVGSGEIKDRMKNATIEDSLFICLGQYQVQANGRCDEALDTDESTSISSSGACAVDADCGVGNTGVCLSTRCDFTGTTCGVTVRRNRFYSVATSPSQSSATCPDSAKCGWYNGMLLWGTTVKSGKGYCSSAQGVIENNFIWHHTTGSSGDAEKAGIGITSNDNDITVQNNTVVGAGGTTARGISLLGTGDYTVRNNLLYSFSDIPIWTNSGTPVNNITYNNLKGSGSNSATIAGATITCANVGTIGAGNICSAPTLVSTSGAPATWDLHLSASDAPDRDAGTVPAPSDDIDKDSRPQGPGIDIGADELAGANPPPHRVIVVASLGLLMALVWIRRRKG